MDKTTHIALSQRGGVNSGKARQERKRLKEELDTLLKSGDVQERVCVALIDKVLSGDARAFAILRDTLGEKEAESIEFFGGKSIDSYREEHAQEIRALYESEARRKFDGKQALYGNLAHTLCDQKTRREVTAQLIQEVTGYALSGGQADD